MDTLADIPALLEELYALPAALRAERLRELDDPAETLFSLIDQCERVTLSRAGDGLALSEMLIALADASCDARPRARSRRARAQALAYAGRFEESLASCREAIAVAEEGDATIESARARLASMHALGELGRYDEAIAAGSAAREAFVAAGQLKLAAHADVNLGIIRQNRDEPREALDHFDRAREALIDEPMRVGWIDNNRGEALLLLHDFAAADAAFRGSLESSERSNSTLAAAIAEGNIADLAARRGEASRALRHFERARRRFEHDNAGSHLTRLIAEQAEALESLGMAEQALAIYAEVMPRLRKLGLASEIARAHAGAGRALVRINRAAEAEDHLSAAEREYERIGQGVARARVSLFRAQAALARGQTAAALALLDSAQLGLADRPIDLALLRSARASVLLDIGDHAAAEREIAAALAVAEELGHQPLVADLLHARSRARRATGEHEAAIADLKRAAAILERTRATLPSERFRAAYMGDRAGLLEELAIALLDAGPNQLDEAFAYVERARGRALLDVVRGSIDETSRAADSDDESSRLVAEAARLRGELTALYGQFDEGVAGRSASAARMWREAVRSTEHALQSVEDRLSSSAARTNARDGVASAREVRAALDEELAIVEYFIAAGECRAFVVRRDGMRVVSDLGSAAEIGNLVERVIFQLGRATRPGAFQGARGDRLVVDARRELHALHSHVFAPLREALRGAKRLAFVPHGPLHLAPLHALWDGHEYLIEQFDVSYAPSSAVFLSSLSCSTDSAEVGIGAELVVGISDLSAPQIEAEARDVSALMPGSTLVLGTEATVSRVIEGMCKARVVHLACHGRYSAQSPLSSGLKLADGWMTVRDISTLRLRAELVTLSGCETGRSLVRSGDEMVGFLREFLAAGARSVLVSQWLANDAITRDFMTVVYSCCYNSVGSGRCSAAVRRAQTALLRKHPHPALWAPFFLVGKP